MSAAGAWQFIKDLVGLGKDLATIVGAVVAVLWFRRQRKHFPRADVSLAVVLAQPVRGKNLLRVIASVANKGDVMIEIAQGFTNLLLVAPADGDASLGNAIRDGSAKRVQEQSCIEWRLLEKAKLILAEPRQIEPGETDEICFDLLLDPWVDTVIVTTSLKNEKKKKDGFAWEKSLVFHIPKGDRDGRTVESAA